MRTSQNLTAIANRLRDAGLDAEANALDQQAGRVQTIEILLDTVLEGLQEPIVFPARRVPGLRLHEIAQAQAAD